MHSASHEPEECEPVKLRITDSELRLFTWCTLSHPWVHQPGSNLSEHHEMPLTSVSYIKVPKESSNEVTKEKCTEGPFHMVKHRTFLAYGSGLFTPSLKRLKEAKKRKSVRKLRRQFVMRKLAKSQEKFHSISTLNSITLTIHHGLESMSIIIWSRPSLCPKLRMIGDNVQAFWLPRLWANQSKVVWRGRVQWQGILKSWVERVSMGLCLTLWTRWTVPETIHLTLLMCVRATRRKGFMFFTASFLQRIVSKQASY